jgi:hypothetical protein
MIIADRSVHSTHTGDVNRACPAETEMTESRSSEVLY